jgi:PAS domain S-box-containing protein
MNTRDVDLPSYEELFEEASCGLLLTNVDGTIREVNSTFCRWIGHSRDELVGKIRLQKLFSIGGRVFHQTHWAPLMQMQGSVSEVQLDVQDRDGKRIPMLFNAFRLQYNGHTFDRISAFVASDRLKYELELHAARKKAETSMAERAEAEIRLQQLYDQLSVADQRKDEFLATLSHELRNPLAPIRNVLEILKLKEISGLQLQKAHAVIERQVQHMTHLVDDLMDVSRITQGKFELRLQKVRLVDIMKNAIEAADHVIKTAAHRLIVSFPDQSITLNADPTRLTQIILNLLTNAGKYTPPEGEIHISGNAVDDHAVIRVRDSGIGIPAEKLQTVFEMFSQLEPALIRSQGGLGIGLALVRGLVELHNGTVTAISEGTGKGSEFMIRLPLSISEAPIRPDVPVAFSQAIVKKRVLVIDDNMDAAETFSTALGLLGYDARSAYDGMAGILTAREFLPDVILLDIGLPILNGYEVACMMRSESWGKSVFLIAATGWGQEKDKALAIEAGFDHHLTKPIDFNQLHAILMSLNS